MRPFRHILSTLKYEFHQILPLPRSLTGRSHQSPEHHPQAVHYLYWLHHLWLQNWDQPCQHHPSGSERGSGRQVHIPRQIMDFWPCKGHHLVLVRAEHSLPFRVHPPGAGSERRRGWKIQLPVHKEGRRDSTQGDRHRLQEWGLCILIRCKYDRRLEGFPERPQRQIKLEGQVHLLAIQNRVILSCIIPSIMTK